MRARNILLAAALVGGGLLAGCQLDGSSPYAPVPQPPSMEGDPGTPPSEEAKTPFPDTSAAPSWYDGGAGGSDSGLQGYPDGQFHPDAGADGG